MSDVMILAPGTGECPDRWERRQERLIHLTMAGLLLIALLLGLLQIGVDVTWPKPASREAQLPQRTAWVFALEAGYQKNITSEPFQLAASGLPVGTSLTYTSSDEAVAVVDGTGTVTVTGPGEATIFVTAEENQTHLRTCQTTRLTVDGRTGIQVAIEALLERWPAGSYFSINGEACPHYSRDTCKNCQLQYILRSMDSDWVLNEDYRDGWTCYAWARFFYRTVFGEILDTEHTTVIATGDPADPATFADAQPGDVLWLYQTGREAKPRHMAIFIGLTDEGLFLYDNNIGGSAVSTGCIRYGVASYERVDANWAYCKVLHANNYDETASW